MATLKKFKVVLHPAKRERGFTQTTMDLFGAVNPTLVFEAQNTTAVIEIVTKFAVEHGKPCAAHVHCLSKPKPSGFDKATEQLYYNLDNAESV